jgi:hypothetical protein
MRRIETIFTLVLLALSLSFSACTKDPCKDVSCSHGTCIEGACQCEPGYSGSNCDVLDPCFGVDCVNGQCQNGNCNCDPGWMGANCDVPDPCFNLSCQNGGYCVNGICHCAFGWEGTNCTVPVSAKCHGNYSMVENCTPSGQPGPYNIYVAPYNQSPSMVLFDLTGLWEAPSVTIRAVIGANGRTFTIQRQAFGNWHEIESLGGTISALGDTISLSYSMYSGTTSNLVDYCSGTMVRF